MASANLGTNATFGSFLSGRQNLLCPMEAASPGWALHGFGVEALLLARN